MAYIDLDSSIYELVDYDGGLLLPKTSLDALGVEGTDIKGKDVVAKALQSAGSVMSDVGGYGMVALKDEGAAYPVGVALVQVPNSTSDYVLTNKGFQGVDDIMAGHQGNRGTQGYQGTQGAQGAVGPQGPQGSGGGASGVTVTPGTNGTQYYFVASTNTAAGTAPLYNSRYGDAAGLYFTGEDIYQFSDERLKTVTGDLDEGLDAIRRIRKIRFFWNNDDRRESEIGVTAQSVLESFPEIVSKDSHGYLSVSYSKLSVIALEAVDRLADKVDELSQKVEMLEGRLGGAK